MVDNLRKINDITVNLVTKHLDETNMADDDKKFYTKEKKKELEEPLINKVMFFLYIDILKDGFSAFL